MGGGGGGGVGGGGVPIYILCILQNSLKSSSGHLNTDPKQYAKYMYQNPSSSSSQDIMLTRFFYSYNARVIKGCNSVMEFAQILIRSYKH